MVSYFINLFHLSQATTTKNHVRVINQLHFTSWPDHGVPKYPMALLEFQKKVDKQHTRKMNIPMLVHCRYVCRLQIQYVVIDKLYYLQCWCGPQWYLYSY